MRNLTILALATIFLFACKQGDTDSDKNEKEFKKFVEKTRAFVPKPINISNVISIMIMSGANYDSTITTSPEQVEKYKSDVLFAAANCGSYTADALYHYAFNNSDAAFESYTAAQILANHLEIGPLYAGSYFDRVDGLEYKGRENVLIEFDNVLQQVDSTLSQHERHQIKLAFMLGNSIEKLYLVDQALQSVEADNSGNISLEANQLLHLFLNQEFALKNLVELVDKYKAKEDSPLFKELLALYALYYELEDRVEPEYKDYETFKRSPEIVAISDQITIVRNMIVQ